MLTLTRTLPTGRTVSICTPASLHEALTTFPTVAGIVVESGCFNHSGAVALARINSNLSRTER